MIGRLGGDEGSAVPWGAGEGGGFDTNDEIFGSFVCYGYFFILLVQLVGTATGDKFPVQVGWALS